MRALSYVWESEIHLIYKLFYESEVGCIRPMENKVHYILPNNVSFSPQSLASIIIE